jgi:anthranilate phosphoribosyltransferase
MTIESLPLALSLLADKKNLPQDLAERIFQIIMNGGATPAQIAAILMGLRIKGETVEEITAGAAVLRAKATKIKAPEGTIDTCGTGGDSRGTYNISTATAIVIAAAGIPVAKHGNRSVSSKSGSADVLEALGIKINADIPVLEKCLNELGITFLMAPKFHAAMRHVSPVRQELGLRTIFNILGPLSNPANPDFQLLGVYDKALLEPLARVLQSLGTKAAWVVHGHDGLDELTLTGPSFVCALKGGDISHFEITPEDAGLPRAMLEDVKGGDAATNAKALENALSGMESAYKNAVMYNAAAGLLIAGKVGDIKAGVSLARETIDNGKAYRLLKQWSLMSNP